MPLPWRRIIVGVLAVVFFATPVALRAVGYRAKPFENRALAGPPTVADGFNFFDETTRFLIDRMPLREQAVRANTWIDEHIFNTTPLYSQNGLGGAPVDQALPFGHPSQDTVPVAKQSNPVAGTPSQVLVGRDGWLYLQAEFDTACHPQTPFSTALRRWEQILAAVRASGRRAILVVAPDKGSIYPEYLPSFPEQGCSRAGKAALYRLLTGAASDGVAALLKPLLAAKRTTHDLLYFRQDTHWNTVGAMTGVRQVLAMISHTVKVEPGDVVRTPPANYRAGLKMMLGQGQTDTEREPGRSIARPSGEPVVPGRTLVVGDSFTNSLYPLLRPYLDYGVLETWSSLIGLKPAAVTALVTQVADADTVVFEIVERGFDSNSVDYFGPTLARALSRGLAGHSPPPEAKASATR